MSLFDRWIRRRGAGSTESSRGEAGEESEWDELAMRAGSLPRSVEPERDLFLGIRNRIELGVEPPRGLRTRIEIPIWAVAAMLALVVGTTIGGGLWMTSGSSHPDDSATIRELANSLRARDGVTDVHVSLLALLEERRAELPPEALAALEDNLVNIDRAITEIHFAFEQHPDNTSLLSLLAAVYRSEVEMLEQLERWTRNAPGVEVPS